MRRVPSAVTVVTVGGEEPRGITIGSFTSTSLNPPLISFNVQQEARAHGLLEKAAEFAVHVLSADQAPLSDHFADPSLDSRQQFEGIAHERMAGGLPILEGASAVFRCTLFARYDAGDHSIFVALVGSVELGPNTGAVLYMDRQYREVGEVILPRS
jgi:flavin reductase (DIM6/NTAB) family NADH-FMN oxidoreductase RutF